MRLAMTAILLIAIVGCFDNPITPEMLERETVPPIIVKIALLDIAPYNVSYVRGHEYSVISREELDDAFGIWAGRNIPYHEVQRNCHHEADAVKAFATFWKFGNIPIGTVDMKTHSCCVFVEFWQQEGGKTWYHHCWKVELRHDKELQKVVGLKFSEWNGEQIDYIRMSPKS